jgi:hypothetical protein
VVVVVSKLEAHSKCTLEFGEIRLMLSHPLLSMSNTKPFNLGDGVETLAA